MKIFPVLFILFLTFNVFAQTSGEILAKANNQSFTSKDLAPSVGETFENLPVALADKRKELLEQQIAEMLLETEAAAKNTTVEKLVQKEVNAKVPDPNDSEIQAVYDANRQNIGDKTVKEMRPQIVAFLRREPEQKALINYILTLKTKYKVAYAKDLNAANLSNSDVLATVGGKQISAADFEAKNKLALYEFQTEVYDQTRDALEQLLFSTVLTAEAKSQNLQPNDLIAREVTNKLHDYTDTERENLEHDLQKKLFQKYNAKILLKEPMPVARNISVEGSPSKGKTNAPVTIVEFSDFQCSHCAAANPVLHSVMAEYGDKIRLVVRNFPLETIHPNAFRAAVAAQAANAQGKFFDYTELLYQNQDKLNDTSLKKFAAQIGLNQKQFDLDLESEKFASIVRRDLQDGTKYGVNATPTIFVNGVKVRSASAHDLRRAIDRALNK